ncbi:MAG: tRNA 2-thiouridine(34) synthase MnmA [Eubacteriales bacterium]|nr:tRNA 2-thiouridine(34) synthase MnmA [Eubacteriales bacterium]
MSRIIVGISGGVDSSVAAYLLQKAGHEVIGCRMRTFDTPASLAEEQSAAEVAEKLGIPLYTVDMREAFAENVIARFADEYAVGRTPNPCLLCNRLVKWQALLACMREHGADLVATGHYAEVTSGVKDSTETEKNTRCCITRVASEKDQSYALYNLTQEEIAHTMFPLAGLSKEEVRDLAREAGLLTAERPDSMEICFIPDNDYAGFLADRFGIKDCPGNYVDEAGNVLGKHQGIVHYTVGQRKGLGIALGKRIFVKEIRPLTNEVVLADDSDVFTDHIFVKDMNFQLLSPETPDLALCDATDGPSLQPGAVPGIRAACVKIRYADRGTPAVIRKVSAQERQTVIKTGMPDRMVFPEARAESSAEGALYRLDFERPVRAAAPGQAAVAYDEAGHILCGGTIL